MCRKRILWTLCILIVGLFPFSQCHLIDNFLTNFELAQSFSENNVTRRRCDYRTDASDIHLTTVDIIQKNGFPFEIHEVTTPDGFILIFHRIPAPGKPVFMMFHGMLMTSNVWFLNCDQRSLPFKLAKAGYDVWLFNARGNEYSHRHVNLTTSDPSYWSYSVDDLIKYDAPTGIDYALKVTGQKNVNWYGWSLGSAVILGLLSSHPEYNEKVNLVFTVGIVAYVGNTKSPLFNILAFVNQLYDRLFTFIAKGGFIPKPLYPVLHTLLPAICTPEARKHRLGICSAFIFLIDGFSPDQLNPPFLPMYLRYFPSYASIKMINQWFQWIHHGAFTYYDYGKRLNVKKYGQQKPPEYDIRKVTARFVNFWSQNDWISTPQDVQRTMERLPNVLHNIRMSDPNWNHFDFTLGKDADLYVYDPVIEILNKNT